MDLNANDGQKWSDGHYEAVWPRPIAETEPIAVQRGHHVALSGASGSQVHLHPTFVESHPSLILNGQLIPGQELKLRLDHGQEMEMFRKTLKQMRRGVIRAKILQFFGLGGRHKLIDGAFDAPPPPTTVEIIDMAPVAYGLYQASPRYQVTIPTPEGSREVTVVEQLEFMENEASKRQGTFKD